jgi:integrase
MTRPPARRRPHGEGAVYQLPNGRWRAMLDAGWRDGRRRRLSSVHDTKRAATTWLRQVQRDREQGRHVEEPVTLHEWLDTYLREVARPNVRDSTYRNYESDFRRHIAPDPDRLQLTEITPGAPHPPLRREAGRGPVGVQRAQHPRHHPPGV